MQKQIKYKLHLCYLCLNKLQLKMVLNLNNALVNLLKS